MSNFFSKTTTTKRNYFQLAQTLIRQQTTIYCLKDFGLQTSINKMKNNAKGFGLH